MLIFCMSCSDKQRGGKDRRNRPCGEMMWTHVWETILLSLWPALRGPALHLVLHQHLSNRTEVKAAVHVLQRLLGYHQRGQLLLQPLLRLRTILKMLYSLLYVHLLFNFSLIRVALIPCVILLSSKFPLKIWHGKFFCLNL